MDALSLWSLGRKLAHWHVPFASRLTRKLELMIFSAYVPTETEIGEHTMLGYGGIGVFIHPQARIGRHCLISHFTSIGGTSGKEGVPVIGDYVRIGTGARILGPIRIGDFAVVGANSVVVRDVPAGTVVFGVPARVVRTPLDPVDAYEQETGLQVPQPDRERARSIQPHRPAPARASGSDHNVLRTDEDPGLFDIEAPVPSENESPADDAPPVTPPRKANDEWPAGEPSAPDPHST